MEPRYSAEITGLWAAGPSTGLRTSGSVLLLVLQCLVYPVGGDGEFEDTAAPGVGHGVGDGGRGGLVAVAVQFFATDHRERRTRDLDCGSYILQNRPGLDIRISRFQIYPCGLR